ncbi:unnamed protein product [Nippostrongylus brasiliensis]|uniref:Apple domain-containing protein n=1 Tax=Nippostrongylus brasiliensis TaxID=27835 RepID=A0A158QX22_NIPBR|nr:unnamed protein product [Nippostrongylus brasiliensis]
MNRPMSSGGSTDGIVMGGDLLKLSSSVSCSELAEVSPYGECFGSLKATFLRKPGWHRLDSFTTVMNSSNIVQTEELVFYFQKTCMRVSHRCGESAAFVFDVRHRYTLRTSAETRREDTEQKCAQVCLDRKCKAFVWDPTERNCLLSHDTQKENLERKPSAIYYENNCLPPSTRCPTGKRVEFLLVRQADVPSFGVSVGVRQVRNCISECINTPLFFCRSIQFNPITSECFVSNESSEMAVSSTTLDLYEPYCSEANDAIPNCNKPFSFEKIITSRLSGTFIIEELNDETVESCLSSCAGMRKKCRGVNYDVKAKRCALMAGSRNLCRKAAGFICRTFSYSQTKQECMVSSKGIESESNYEKYTQESAMFHLYVRHGLRDSVENRHRDMPMKSLGGSIGPNTSISQLASVFDPELQQLSEFESIPRLTSLSEHVGFVPPDGVKDKVVSAVIVMSNDRVLPHDVTTKDDLFFHVTCNYTSSKVNEIRRGIVVGISLQIMKKGRPVDSVFIGETLIARVQSEIPAERLRVVDCTAHRVGGTGPPASVGLIADGCALLPSLMAPMKMGDEGWESPLSAFRIDGSEQIDVVCMVVVCSDEACPNSFHTTKGHGSQVYQDVVAVNMDEKNSKM